MGNPLLGTVMLSDLAVRAAKPRGKQYRLTDERGLYLLVRETGGKLWRFDYRYGGRRYTLALGQFPSVPLSRARAKRDEARKLLSDGLDPAFEKKRAAAAATANRANTFEVVADEQLALMRSRGLAEQTLVKTEWLLKKLASPLLGRPIGQITTPEVLSILRAVELSGRRESAVRLRSAISAVFAIAIIDGRASADPTFPLRQALAPPIVEHHAAIVVPRKLGALLRSIDSYDGWPTIGYGLRFFALTFPRPGALRAMEWDEVDWEESVWRIPAKHMKKIRGRPALPHDVPLARQAREVLRSVRQISGNSKLVFPSIRATSRPLSENAFNSALMRMGYGSDEATPHGFRTSASTLLNESGRHREDVIEFQLSHIERNKIRAAYNRAQYWDERVAMMDDWANMLDTYRSM